MHRKPGHHPYLLAGGLRSGRRDWFRFVTRAHKATNLMTVISLSTSHWYFLRSLSGLAR